MKVARTQEPVLGDPAAGEGRVPMGGSVAPVEASALEMNVAATVAPVVPEDPARILVDPVDQAPPPKKSFMLPVALSDYVPPTREEMAASVRKWYEADAPNCISRWFPLLEGSGLRMPETRIFLFEPELHLDLMDACEGDGPWPTTDLFERLHEAYQGFGEHAFMKLGNFSDKHSWRETCHLRPGLKASDIESQFVRIMYDQVVVGCSESLAVAIREMIPTKPAFLAKEFGDMPVTRERRIFTDHTCEAVCSHPYWPEEVFRSMDPEKAAALAEINLIRPEEDAYLRGQAAIAAERLKPLDAEGWSIDFLQDVHGEWWLIDVARARQSYHWPHVAVGEEVR